MHDSAIVSEAPNLISKYNVGVRRLRSWPPLAGFAKAKPYTATCRLGFEGEMEVAPPRMISIHLPGLIQLPDDFGLIRGITSL